MRKNTDHLELRRFMGPKGSMCGAFLMEGPTGPLRVIASDGEGWEGVMPLPAWEHVSVSTPDRCPTWNEMNWVKDQFWGSHELVVQFHPPRDQYVNCHPNCLHLWKPIGVEIPLPPKQAIA